MNVNLSEYASAQEVIELKKEILQLYKNQEMLLEKFKQQELTLRIFLDYIKKKDFNSNSFETNTISCLNMENEEIVDHDEDDDDDSFESE